MAEIAFRRAKRTDIAVIVAMLADDKLGSSREDIREPLAEAYLKAFEAIDTDPNQFLAVMTEADRVVGTLQLTFIAGLSRRGALRGQIESVRVIRDRQGTGLGQKMIEWAVDQCRERGCAIVQLTTDRSRLDAHRFYERLGFKQTHLGYKIDL
ncbi:GNAT family N-acetyltransferase [Mesorhizobium retamae]|uniref:GNAT family N-acetyltransferase n=1 Tax=Mesorhizobium retamae TaxID=2912854 RepID=A0ABS9QPR8_9HYPH|nr:GNAT family N-acetyltransferase [Mesorhizobium sp. IRAMC:0171]MCG7508686.1 GNAT family N-acetyltransferase [Mesorhizobium sp. IRAMC:0171]